MNRPLSLSVNIGLLVVSGMACAQSVTQPDPVDLESVSVTGVRIDQSSTRYLPFAVSTIDRRFMLGVRMAF